MRYIKTLMITSFISACATISVKYKLDVESYCDQYRQCYSTLQFAPERLDSIELSCRRHADDNEKMVTVYSEDCSDLKSCEFVACMQMHESATKEASSLAKKLFKQRALQMQKNNGHEHDT